MKVNNSLLIIPEIPSMPEELIFLPKNEGEHIGGEDVRKILLIFPLDILRCQILLIWFTDVLLVTVAPPFGNPAHAIP